jgi:dihydrofolate reductase
LIVGGAHIATSFLKDELIDELWLTLEPKIFGIGANFVIKEKLDIRLKLISCTTANQQGTLMMKYRVLHGEELLR